MKGMSRTAEIPEPPNFKPAVVFPSSSILIDASTYVAAKSALEEGVLDGPIVYNLANFLQCLVLAEKVYLAPSVIWVPDKSEVLFSNYGPCEQLDLQNWDENELRYLFQLAVRQSIDDLKRQRLINTSISGVFSSSELTETKKLLVGWQSDIDHNPREFLVTYSGQDYLTDQSTQRFLAQLPAIVKPTAPSYRKLAHHLLRVNAAIVFSNLLPYHPHSHRALFVCRKMGCMNRGSENLSHSLLREAEELIGEAISETRRAVYLAGCGTLRDFESDMPLVLAVALRESHSPVELIKSVMTLRNQTEAINYRLDMAELQAVMHSGPVARAEALRKLNYSREALATELLKLYGAQRIEIPGSVSNLVTTVDTTNVITENWLGMVVDILKQPQAIAKLYQEMAARRRVAFLINLAKRRGGVDKLNPLLKQVFHKELSPDQLQELKELRASQAKGISRLVQRHSN